MKFYYIVLLILCTSISFGYIYAPNDISISTFDQNITIKNHDLIYGTAYIGTQSGWYPISLSGERTRGWIREVATGSIDIPDNIRLPYNTIIIAFVCNQNLGEWDCLDQWIVNGISDPPNVYQAELGHMIGSALEIDALASNGRSFGSTDPFVDNTEVDAHVVHFIEVPDHGEYQIQARVKAPSELSNSFRIVMDNSDTLQWQLGTTAGYQWQNGPTFTLEKGHHVLSIYRDDPGTYMDLFRIIKVANYDPGYIDELQEQVGAHQVPNPIQGGPPLSAEITVGGASDLFDAINDGSPGTRINLKEGIYSGVEYFIPYSLQIIAEPGVKFIDSRFTIQASDVVIQGIEFFQSRDPSITDSFRFDPNGFKPIDIQAPNVRITQNKFWGMGCCHPTNDYGRIIQIGLYAHDVEIDHNVFINNSGQLIALSQPSDLSDTTPEITPKRTHVHHNTIMDQPRYHLNGGEFIMTGLSWMDMVEGYDNNASMLIENNKILRFYGDSEIISIKSEYNTIQQNEIRDSGTAHISVRAGDKNTIDSNLFINNTNAVRFTSQNNSFTNNIVYTAPGGVPLLFMNGFEYPVSSPNSGLISYYPAQNNTIAHNTFIGGSQIFKIIGQNYQDEHEDDPIFIAQPKNNSIVNNIFFSDTFSTSPIVHVGEIPEALRYDFFADNTVDNNIIWKDGTLGSTWPSLLASNINENPQLNGFIPGLNSPANDSGLGVGVLHDYNNSDRSFSNPDIGAIEQGAIFNLWNFIEDTTLADDEFEAVHYMQDVGPVLVGECDECGSVGGDAILTIQLDTNGTEVWRAINDVSPGNEGAQDIAVYDQSVYVTGSCLDCGNLGGNTLYLLKYTDGILDWNVTLDFSTGNDIGATLSIDATGIYVGGLCSGCANPSSISPIIAKFDFDGNHIWSKSQDTGIGLHFVFDSDLDSSGNFYTVGGCIFSCFHSPYGQLLKFNANGDFLTYRFYDIGIGLDYLTSIEIDTQDNVYVSGTCQECGETGGQAMYIQKMNSELTEQWTYIYDPSTLADVAIDLASDESGLYVGGYCDGCGNKGGDAWVTLKLSDQGALAWINITDVTGLDDQVNALHIGDALYVAGYCDECGPLGKDAGYVHNMRIN